jgi:FmdE, Molybdenum formylmethanofuran dehydrogenase operon
VLVKHPLLVIAAFLLSLMVETPARAETPEQWVEIGPRIHGAFGAFIPIGIRVGLDRKEKLNAGALGLGVTFYNEEKAPCPCIADGVMIATQASPGQGTLRIASEIADCLRRLRQGCWRWSLFAIARRE